MQNFDGILKINLSYAIIFYAKLKKKIAIITSCLKMYSQNYSNIFLKNRKIQVRI